MLVLTIPCHVCLLFRPKCCPNAILSHFHLAHRVDFEMARMCENIALEQSKPPKANHFRLLFIFASVGASFVDFLSPFLRHFLPLSVNIS